MCVCLSCVGIVDYMRAEARPDWEPPKDLVMILTNDNFTQVVSESELMLVEFYAPWCGHCKRLAPEYTKAARDLEKYNIPLAKVDATQETQLAERYGVSGYPTLKVMRAGKDYDYTGPRERYGNIHANTHRCMYSLTITMHAYSGSFQMLFSMQ